MTQRSKSPAGNRAHRSELDRRAINVAGHLLLGFVWLECRLASVPDQLGSVDVSGWIESTRRLRAPVRSSVTGIASPGGKRNPVEHE